MRMRLILAILLGLGGGSANADEYTRKPQLKSITQGNITNTFVVGAGSWAEMVASVQQLRNIPRDKDTEVLLSLTLKEKELPPIYLLEVARRTCEANPQQAINTFVLATTRMRFDALRCRDKSARGGVTMTLRSLQMPICANLWTTEHMLVAYENIRERRDLFDYSSSPWWMCSHGMSAVMAATNNKTLERDDWLIPEIEVQAAERTIRGMLMRNIKGLSEKLGK